jgi:hypothetical protein
MTLVRGIASSVAPICVGVTRLAIMVSVMWYKGIEIDLEKREMTKGELDWSQRHVE